MSTEAAVHEADAKVRQAAEGWEAALAALVDSTKDLGVAIGARSGARVTAFGDEPRWGKDQDRVFARVQAAIAGVLREGVWRDPAAAHYRTHRLTELI